MAANSSSLMSTASYGSWHRRVELRWFAVGAVELGNGCRYASAGRAVLGDVGKRLNGFVSMVMRVSSVPPPRVRIFKGSRGRARSLCISSIS